MKKRLLSLLCVLVLTVSLIPAASALEGEAARAADTLSTLGLIDSTYNLDAPATRAQAAVLLVPIIHPKSILFFSSEIPPFKSGSIPFGLIFH